MMRLLRSWRDSLLLLAPQNFKLFALVTLKSTLETYKVLAHIVLYFFLLPVIILFQQLYFGKEAFMTRYVAPLSVPLYIITGAMFLFIAVWITVTICLATRPSIEKKTLHYFNAHRWFTIILGSTAIIIWQLGFWLHWYFSAAHPVLMSAHAIMQVLLFLTLVDFVPTIIFFILFFLDSDGSMKQLFIAALRAVKMMVYNLPLLFILRTIIGLPSFLVAQFVIAHHWLIYVLALLYIFLLKPLIINIWTNIYIKRLHEMPDLYFKQPE